jgi:hypothetical protein
VIAESRGESAFDLARLIDEPRCRQNPSRRPTVSMRESSYASEARSGGGVLAAEAK